MKPMSLRPSRNDSWLRTLVRASAVILLVLALALSSQHAPPLLNSVRHHPYFRVSTVEIEGNRRVPREQLVEWIHWQDDVSIWDIDPDTLTARLAQHPWVRGATVQRIFPRRVRIQVRERRPVALVQVAKGFQYVDRTGKVLGPVHSGEAPDLPIISGVDQFKERELSSLHVHRALQLLRICERLQCFDSISQVQIGRKGLVVIPVRNRVAVVLGWGGFAEKLRRSARVFAMWEGQVDRLRVLDLSFPKVAVLKVAPEERVTPSSRKTKRRPGHTEA
ncbi:MAG: FtsQ-type POTRA domain-containing protein [Candidatus Binatia bacterium]|nr:FtsQ-type POTRA domain-containing protein [Candidatus Binatia bacterium]